MSQYSNTPLSSNFSNPTSPGEVSHNALSRAPLSDTASNGSQQNSLLHETGMQRGALSDTPLPFSMSGAAPFSASSDCFWQPQQQLAMPSSSVPAVLSGQSQMQSGGGGGKWSGAVPQHFSQQALFDMVSKHTAYQRGLWALKPPLATNFLQSGPNSVALTQPLIQQNALPSTPMVATTTTTGSEQAQSNSYSNSRLHSEGLSKRRRVSRQPTANGMLDGTRGGAFPTAHMELSELVDRQSERQQADFDLLDLEALTGQQILSSTHSQQNSGQQNAAHDLVLPWGLFEGGAEAVGEGNAMNNTSDFSNICLDNWLQDWDGDIQGEAQVAGVPAPAKVSVQQQASTEPEVVELSLGLDSNNKVVQQHDGKVRQLWHKYGRKMVRASPDSKVQFQRAYFKCHEKLCNARLLVDSEFNGSSTPKLLKSAMTGQHNHKILYAASLGDASLLDTTKPICGSCQPPSQPKAAPRQPKAAPRQALPVAASAAAVPCTLMDLVSPPKQEREFSVLDLYC